MTKEQWLEDRNKVELSIDVWFDYYKDTGGKSDNKEDFSKAFGLLVSREAISILGESLYKLNFDSAIERIHKYYNNKFEI